MRLLIWLFFLLFVAAAPARAQQISIELGKSPLPINQYFTISIRLQDQQLKEYTPFPQIQGFKKSSRYSSTKTITTAGNTTTILTIVQNYAPLEEGQHVLKPFSMKVNGQTVQSQGMTIQVTPMQANAAQSPNLPDLITDEEEQPAVVDEEPEFLDKEDKAFLNLYTSKKEVFVGESVTIALYFYLAEEDQRLLDFYDFANQMTGIMRQLKQANAWEEAFEFTEISPEQVLVKGKPYLRFRLYEAVLYPINLQDFRFPQLQLKMIKYRLARNPNLLAEDRQEGYKTFYAPERVVQVKELPPHPLRNVVPVGRYRLQERLTQQHVPVNKSFTYHFEVRGEGNLSAIMPPVPAGPPGLEFYPPDVRQDITRRQGRVLGGKTFAFTVLPREPGTYNMGQTMEWIYFDPVTAAYDTLRPVLLVHVTGARDSDALVLSRDLGAFYNIIENEDNKLVSLHFFEEIRRYTNIVLFVLLAITAFVFIKK